MIEFMLRSEYFFTYEKNFKEYQFSKIEWPNKSHIFKDFVSMMNNSNIIDEYADIKTMSKYYYKFVAVSIR